jgi:hypothetical protein
MKKCVLWALLLCAGFPLFAKSPSGYYIYIPPVSGVGKSPEDNALFAGSLAGQVTANNHIITENQDRANFILTPELSHIPGQEPSGQLYLLRVTLIEKKTNTIIAEQDLIYSTPEEAGSLLVIMMGNVFSAVTGIPDDKPEWFNNLYLGASALWSPRVYSRRDTQITKMSNFGGGVLAELQFRNSMSVETGVTLMPEWIGIIYADGVDRLDWILGIPLLLKYTFNPGIHLIEPYGGIYFNFPLYGVGRPPLLSWCLGLQYGIKAGPGVFFIDTHFSMDIEASRLNKTADGILYSNRSQINAGLGYKFDLFR